MQCISTVFVCSLGNGPHPRNSEVPASVRPTHLLAAEVENDSGLVSHGPGYSYLQ